MFLFQHKKIRTIWRVALFLLLTSFVAPKINFPETPNFHDSERLTFRVRLLGISAGEMTAVAKKTEFDGNEVFHTVLRGKTTGLADKIYKVDDIYESFFDPATNLPRKAIRNIREGSYRYYDEVLFNHGEKYIISQRKGKVEVPKNTLDMAAVFYYIRRLDIANLKLNDTISISTYFGDSLFPFHIVYKGRETITINSGEYRCLKFIPVVETGRVFKNEDDMKIWFSDDANKIPVSIRFDIWAGSFKCELSGFENLKYPLTAKIK